MKCRLCSSEQVVEFFRESRDGQTYTALRCHACGVIGIAENHHAISPDYVDLTAEQMDSKRIFNQSQHKHPAFLQWRAVVEKEGGRPLGRLLDIGCGTGGFLRYAADLGWQVHGFDASQAQVEHARKYFPDVRCATSCQEYLDQINVPDLRFSMITLWDVFEHVRIPKPFLREMGTLLEPDGLIFFSIPNAGALFWKKQIHRLLGRPFSLDPWEHVFYYTVASLSDLLLEMDFQVVQSGSVVCYPRSLTLFEAARRGGFFLLRAIPSLAPQIYLLARKRSVKPILSFLKPHPGSENGVSGKRDHLLVHS